MDTLLVDAGNTAVKARSRDGAFSAQFFYGDAIARLPQAGRIVGCCVADAARRAWIEGLAGRRIEWLESGNCCCGVDNRYGPGLGPDRWFAAVGAAALFPGRTLVVVHAGTAIVADTVLFAGGKTSFAGGLIAPGIAMMRASLASGTARLKTAWGQSAEIPACTADAISTGVLAAASGVVRHALSCARRNGFRPLLVVTGGDAGAVRAALSDEPSEVVENLVLEGLAAALPHSPEEP